MKDCPVPNCLRRCNDDVLLCRPHWSMVRGGDGGVLARSIYRAVAVYRRDPNPETLKELRDLQQTAIDKAARRQRDLDAQFPPGL